MADNINSTNPSDIATRAQVEREIADWHPQPSEGPWGVNSQDFGQRARTALQETSDGQ